jgi:hypothetical protein
MLDSIKRLPTRGIYLVSCVRRKCTGTHRARDLYVSNWFRAARAVVEATGCPWFILSAKHALLHPEEMVQDYDLAL